MAVSVITLWLIYVLVILVVAIVLSLPDLKMPHQSLIAVFFATVIAAVVVSFVPVDLNIPAAIMSYNTLLVVAYLLPIILIIVIAASGIHHHYNRMHHDSKESTNIDVTCDQNEEGEPVDCRLDRMTMRTGRDRVRVSFR